MEEDEEEIIDEIMDNYERKPTVFEESFEETYIEETRQDDIRNNYEQVQEPPFEERDPSIEEIRPGNEQNDDQIDLEGLPRMEDEVYILP